MAISLASLRQTTTLTPPRILIHGVTAKTWAGLSAACVRVTPEPGRSGG